MNGGRRHLVRLAALLATAGLAVPASAVHPTTLSLTRVESAEEVDFAEGVVWILALGSDAEPGQALEEARMDAIQLVGLDLERGRAVGIGIPRDYYLELPGGRGEGRINELNEPDAAAEAVADLVGIEPDYVLVARFEGFRDMVDAIGGIAVHSDQAFSDSHTGITVRKGWNSFDGDEALDYTRSRRGVVGDDFSRSANQQGAMLGILRELLAQEGDAGFMERGTLAALAGLRTDLSPIELYRLAQAVTLVRPGRVTTCVLPGDPGTSEFGASVVFPRFEEARSIGEDVAEDVRLDQPCWLTRDRPPGRG